MRTTAEIDKLEPRMMQIIRQGIPGCDVEKERRFKDGLWLYQITRAEGYIGHRVERFIQFKVLDTDGLVQIYEKCLDAVANFHREPAIKIDCAACEGTGRLTRQ